MNARENGEKYKRNGEGKKQREEKGRMAIKLRIAFRKQTQLSKVIEVQYMYY